jgi:mono/diheme cytochrome c family protein
VRRGLAFASALLPAALAGPAAAERPEILYMLHCRGCHLADGAGAPGSVPDLRGQLGKFLLVSGGREYLVRVPGSASAPIDDAELASLLNWMIGRFGPADVARDFRRYRAPEVARYRASPLTDVDALRAQLVRQIAAGAAASP